ncbi:BMP family ABC transporter substrate-binding protein [Bacillus atrophaeus]|uniref:BMP family ABC transporter substrate-binding protein n=1 Tax=Bacillus atrophaeus TaxID=1452 RepID=UPI00227E3084|nr:BMP family ABC transporter substrate-binding protein [Bacillus atrophaeus]MCY8911803.1 BMP family ABC transporter substrate-binding protein [Bacillus atrophaeus]MCY9115321.1 BMP family ABC transporter substrate-binding protein [Bacillus atrophaeus]MEC0924818.1 BMP family ABC transporter substrate-binding protein [Bacillus atrophaeus]MEC0933433.1 BMP family ABC transporter substrate-binding protein [Bacillus atrophaeus]
MITRLVMIFSVLLLLSGCGQTPFKGKIEKVGMLFPDTINDLVWGTKGYKGLLSIQSAYNVDVYYKEGVKTDEDILNAIEDYHKRGINLLFGHGSEYEEMFNLVSEDYPDMEFVISNAESKADNVTSVHLNGEAMGFFGGMTAAHMSKTNQIGVIASFKWQPEVDGFIKGAKYENPDITINTKYTDHWDDNTTAVKLYEKIKEEGADVVYPAGDGYNVPVIQQIKKDGLYAIGYVTDQSDQGENTVLTSTVQNVDKAYGIIAEQYSKGTLESGNHYFDFKDHVVEMGTFSPLVDKAFQDKIAALIKTYNRTDELPKKE